MVKSKNGTEKVLFIGRLGFFIDSEGRLPSSRYYLNLYLRPALEL